MRGSGRRSEALLKTLLFLAVIAVVARIFGCSSGKGGQGRTTAPTVSLEATDIVVEHLWDGTSTSAATAVPFHVIGDVTNHGSRAVGIEDMPELAGDETDAFVDLIFIEDDVNDEIEQVEPGQTLTFDYYAEVDAPYGSWRFVQGDDVELQGLDGVAEQIQPTLRQAFDELSALLLQEEELREEERESSCLSRPCWVTETGTSYHTNPNCFHIRGRDTFDMTVEEAIDEDYEACADRVKHPN